MAKGRHRNSIEAFQEMNISGARKTVALKIYNLMTGEPPLTDRQIAGKLGFSDVYTARRRVSDLIKDGIFVEDTDTVDNETNKSVRTVRIATDLERICMVEDEDNKTTLEEMKDIVWKSLKDEGLLTRFLGYNEVEIVIEAVYGLGFLK